MADEEQGVTEPVAEVQQGASQEAPISDKEINFRAIREANENLKRQNEFLQMQLMQQEQVRPQADTNPSFKDDDLLTFGEYQKLQASFEREKAELKSKLDEMEMRYRHSDYNEVIQKYLPDVLQDDPDLAYAIKDNPRMQKLAYKLAQSSPKYHQERLTKQNASAIDRMVENSTRPQPANARKNITVQDEEARMMSMSDEDLWKQFNMAKARS